MSIYHISLQYKAFAGSRRGTYLNIKNGDYPICVFLTGDQFTLKHVSLMHMCNKTNNNEKFRFFKSKENIRKKEVGPYRGFGY